MNITDRDRLIVDNLVDPNDEKQTRYTHDYRISQKILGMLISDRYFLVQSMDLIKSEYFEDESHRLICSIVFDFFKQYQTMPSKVFIQNEIKERRSNSDLLIQYLGELETVILDYIPGIDNREYLLDKIVEFAKEQAARVAVAKTMEVLKRKPKGSWSKIWDLWREALTTDKGHDLGLDYFSSLEERYDRMTEQKLNKGEVFTSGFIDYGKTDPKNRHGLDGLLTAGGLCRGEIGAYVGLSGSGKSINLINAGFQNLISGKKVCYITLEMSQDKIATRFDALLSEEPFRCLIDNRKMVIDAVRSHIRHEVDQRRLVIKHYPGGTADINTFRAYLSQLNLYGFKPDLLVIDYVGELKDLPGMKTYESRQLLVRDMHTLAQEEQMCILTAIQANRKGKEVQEFEGSIDEDAIADSFGQMRPLDACWSLNKYENASNLGHIFVMKHRDGISKRHIHYEMNTETLRMSEITYTDYQARIAEFRSKKGNETSVPKIEVE